MAEAIFDYKGIKLIIQCKTNEKMKDIFKRFKDKAKIDNNIFYFYNGKVIINDELTFIEIISSEDKQVNKMNIIASDNEINKKERTIDIVKSKNIICPKCKESIKMDIKDYKITLYGCKNNHNIENILLNEFGRTQNIDRAKIICDICKKNNKSISYNNIFYKCFNCNKNICPLCKSIHEKDHNIINYDDKFYICHKHNDNYISFCEECNKNLCMLCNDHINHKRINFIDILPKKEEIDKKLEELKKYINLFNNDIKMLMNLLNGVKNKMNFYYKINEDIIKNYDNKNRNFEIIYYLNQFQNNNIVDELKNVINGNNPIYKFNNIFDIYKKMNIDEINLIYKVKDKKEVQIFGKYFVERNKNNCKLIIEGQEQELKETHSFGYFFGTSQDLLKIKLKGITNITNMSCMFSHCSSLLSLPDISKWNTNTITNMNNLFYECSSLKSLPDISKWNTSFVTNMSHMFYKCSSLLTLPNISKWNTSNVIDMSYMFNRCSSLKSVPDISIWNTSNVLDIGWIFRGCKNSLKIPSKFQ